ncbi:hypothetical protein PAEPH01_1180 [Pancytospora epiphaga]|nr:hypothetical protein PAEPH01_1180 [Pancytospora epiphaga]
MEALRSHFTKECLLVFLKEHIFSPMENNNEDDMIPMQYLNNENPYAFCRDYHMNSINMPEKKLRLSALQRIQPQKLYFRMPRGYLERERNYTIDQAVSARKAVLIRRGMGLLGFEFHDNPEELFYKNIENVEILDIALELKKLSLIHHQKKLRTKVSVALNKKLSDNVDYSSNVRKCLEIDNLKDALIFCKLEDLYEKKQ